MTVPLTELQVLVLDCQATGAGPDKGHLLEIGWAKTCAAAGVCPQSLSATSYLAQLPRDVEIPAAVERLTGISKASLGNALPLIDIRRKVVAAAREAVGSGHRRRCPTVIHYAHYERPFLRALHAADSPETGFPLQIICTHAIAGRLLPGLPRKGLRALAGCFGHTLSPLRRSADHAVATAVVWHHLVEALKSRHGIETLDQLTAWLDHTPLERRVKRMYPMKAEKRIDLPDKPGVYCLRRANGDLLYIGKAISLKKRVNSYFRPKGARGEHILEMLSQAAEVDVTRTGSALEAAVLESDEIKRHAPPYNVALQQGQRNVVFLSGDLRNSSATADTTHCIGPLPGENTAAALAAFAAWQQNGRIPSGDEPIEIGNAILGIPAAWAPPPECLAEGLALFGRRHRLHLKRPGPLRALTGLGAALWRTHRLEKARTEEIVAADEDEIDAPEPQSREGRDWTPESVAAALDKSIMRTALLFRRSRWLCLLSESTLAWAERSSQSRSQTVLVLEKGTVCRRRELPAAEAIPVPPGYAKRRPERQPSFDLKTYERLRVITTELRRIAAEGRQIKIRLGPGSVLYQRQLTRILPWV